MTDEDRARAIELARCEPPPDLRGKRGWHRLTDHAGGITAYWAADVGRWVSPWPWGRTPQELHALGWHYLKPVEDK